MFKFLTLITSSLFILLSVAAAKDSIKDLPSWYVSPKQNNASSLYGVGEGFSLEEATKTALADAAARLIVTISSESTLLREENQNSSNEESRQQINQNIL